MPDLVVKAPPSGRGAAVVLLGGEDIESLRARIAALGYFALFPARSTVADIQAAITHARNLPGATGKVGVLAFGGTCAYEAACFTDADCAVGYEPAGIENMVSNAGRITKWCQLHMPEQDPICPPETQKKIYGALIGIIFYSIYNYKGVARGFAREGGPNYDKAAAELANARTEKFLKENLQ
jgi:carboxymethylenebutenolidase